MISAGKISHGFSYRNKGYVGNSNGNIFQLGRSLGRSCFLARRCTFSLTPDGLFFKPNKKTTTPFPRTFGEILFHVQYT